MAQRNEVILVGKIASTGVRYKMSKSGNEYLYFTIELENQTHSNEWESEYFQRLHIMCFKRPVVKYMKNLKAKGGNFVVIFGFAGSFSSEIKGKQLLQNCINATEIYVIKTKPTE